MERDLKVLDYLVRSMEDAVPRLEKAVSENKIEDTTKIKKAISDLSQKIMEEIGDGNRGS